MDEISSIELTERPLSDHELLAVYIDSILTQVKWAITIPALFISVVTVLVFVFNKKLRQQHNIFPFNIALADMMAILNYALLLDGVIYHRDKLAYALQCTYMLVSYESIVLVALYRYLNIIVDPFSNRQLVTTTRCAIVGIGSWILTAGVVAVSAPFLTEAGFVIMVSSFFLLFAILAGLFNLLVYRGITTFSTTRSDGVDVAQRLKENKRVLKTFLIIYVTTTAGWLGGSIVALRVFLKDDVLLAFLYLASELFFLFTWISDVLIYWVRLEEFRSLLSKAASCKRRRLYPVNT